MRKADYCPHCGAVKSEIPGISMSGKYKTRSGQEVRIYCIDAGGPYPVHGAIIGQYKPIWKERAWTRTGRAGGGKEHPHDLIEIMSKL